MRHEAMVYSYVCDTCGDGEDLEIDELPDGWTADGDEHYCERHS